MNNLRNATISGSLQIDEILNGFQNVIASDFPGLRNHCQRVFAYAIQTDEALSEEDLQKLAIVAAFHDLGIWTHKTFDYLDPSVQLARSYLITQGKQEWSGEISEMIRRHHQILPYKKETYPLVEHFRKADWWDVSWGLLAPRHLRDIFLDNKRQFPNCGFHLCLMHLGFKRMLSHPLSPLPMLRIS